MKLVSYFGDWRDEQWQCEHCEWCGKGSELADGEMFSEVMEMDCPRCHTPVVYFGFPTIAESRAHWDKLPPLDRQLLRIAEASQRTFEQARLRDPSQLPDLGGDRLVLEWDCDMSATEMPSSSAPGWQTVIRWGSMELWREPAYYECYQRFLDVIDILVAKYGARLHDLVPTEASWLYLYGDRLSASNIVDTARARLRNGNEPPADDAPVASETQSLPEHPIHPRAVPDLPAETTWSAEDSPRQRRSAKRAKRNVIVSVSWGYERYDCPMAMQTWKQILAGRPVHRREPYWYEGERFTGEWYFNSRGVRGALRVEYEGGGVGFDGKLDDAWIEIDEVSVLWREVSGLMIEAGMSALPESVQTGHVVGEPYGKRGADDIP